MKTKHQVRRNASKSAGATQSETPSRAGQGREPVPWYEYIPVKREWLSVMNILPGDAIGLDPKAKPRAGDFVLLDMGVHPYICQLVRQSRTHYHCRTFRLRSECSFKIKY